MSLYTFYILPTNKIPVKICLQHRLTTLQIRSWNPLFKILKAKYKNGVI